MRNRTCKWGFAQIALLIIAAFHVIQSIIGFTFPNYITDAAVHLVVSAVMTAVAFAQIRPDDGVKSSARRSSLGRSG